MVELALTIIGGIIAAVFAQLALTAVVYVFAAIGIAIETVWNKLNSFGRALIFGTPLLAASYGLFYWLFYIVIPYFAKYETARIVLFSILGLVAYLACFGIGWKRDLFSKCELGIKRKGKFALIARIIAILPFSPIVYLIYYIKEVFGALFITNYKAVWIPGFIFGNEYKQMLYDMGATTSEVDAIFETFEKEDFETVKNVLHKTKESKTILHNCLLIARKRQLAKLSA